MPQNGQTAGLLASEAAHKLLLREAKLCGRGQDRVAALEGFAPSVGYVALYELLCEHCEELQAD